MNFVLYWLMAFLGVIVFKIVWIRSKDAKKAKDSMIFTEAIGLPLTFMQPVVFFKSLLAQDFLGILITLWWGLGFLAVILLLLIFRLLKQPINWGNAGIYISWLCKLYYVAYAVLCFAWTMPKLLFAFSAWIASDQIEKSFASLDADRTRRTFHDFWLIRILYPSFLFVPLVYNLETAFTIYGIILFALWAAGLFFVWKKKKFMELPDNPTLLRNMIYFKK